MKPQIKEKEGGIEANTALFRPDFSWIFLCQTTEQRMDFLVDFVALTITFELGKRKACLQHKT